MTAREFQRRVIVELVQDMREQEKLAEREGCSTRVAFLQGREQGLRVALHLLGMSALDIQQALAAEGGPEPGPTPPVRPFPLTRDSAPPATR